jgi:hypothetical protein
MTLGERARNWGARDKLGGAWSNGLDLCTMHKDSLCIITNPKNKCR